MTDGPTVYQGSGALQDMLTGAPAKVPPSLSAISYLPTTKAGRWNFQPTTAHSPSGHRTTAHSPSGHCHITPFLVNRGLDPKPDFCDPNPSSTFSSRPTSRLILNWSPLELISLHLNRTFSRGGRGLFIGISNQSGTSRVAARVSLRMAPDACAATPCAPHGWLHDLLTCKVTPHPLPVWMHGLAPCKETPRPPHVWPHGLVACIAIPRAWPIHLVLHMSTCM
ncbi:hypothetical protein F2Q70_00035618 [Brassica cretica]|uniref:Uncharacterized protein n=1 Tax=Brassica cretica TaxID=69181 RepID=A0A8S9JU46_BRACR|nr:hypothetical protein F2Q70_00035618 [Brassica cretica]